MCAMIVFAAATGGRGYASSGPGAPDRPKSYVPPTGIPAPRFGIDQTHWMYADANFQYDYGDGPRAYRRTIDGPYTHYVDPSAPNASDAENTFGTPERPRRSMPEFLPAGSVVQVRGRHESRWVIQADGSASAPVFVRGASERDRPTIAAKVLVHGRYVILENLLLIGQNTFAVAPGPRTAPHHVAVRHCEFAGEGKLSSGVALIAYGDPGRDVHHVVFYRNHIRDQGDPNAGTKTDRHGIAVTRHTHHVWVLNNRVYRSQADAVQVNGWENETTHHVYIGGNVFHEDGENAVDIKEASHVIVSENVMYKYGHKDGAVIAHRDGKGATGPENVWVLFNHIYQAQSGIVNVGITGEFYAIGNVVHDMADAGLKSWQGGRRYYLANIICDVGRGIAHGGTAPVRIADNMIGNCSRTSIYLPEARAVSRIGRNMQIRNMKPNRQWYSAILQDDASQTHPATQPATGEAEATMQREPEILSSETRACLKKFFDTYGQEIETRCEGILRRAKAALDHPNPDRNAGGRR